VARVVKVLLHAEVTMRVSILTVLIITSLSLPAAAEASTASHVTNFAASPWIVLGVVAIVRTLLCFMERSEGFDLER
jgi:hypothetical protein